MQRAKESMQVYLGGALGYGLLELLWRGRTHWTMLLTGGACFLIIYHLNDKLAEKSLWVKCMAGAFIITALELAVGSIVNLALGWNVWDYSRLPLHFMGQICLVYSLMWFLLCIPLHALCNRIRRHYQMQNQ